MQNDALPEARSLRSEANFIRSKFKIRVEFPIRARGGKGNRSELGDFLPEALCIMSELENEGLDLGLERGPTQGFGIGQKGKDVSGILGAGGLQLEQNEPKGRGHRAALSFFLLGHTSAWASLLAFQAVAES